MLYKKEPKEIGWMRIGQQNGPKLSESSILLVGEGVFPHPKNFQWMHEGDRVLNQGMIAHVGIIDGTLLEEAVWAPLFPFTLHNTPLNGPSEVGCNVGFFGRTVVIVNKFNICT